MRRRGGAAVDASDAVGGGCRDAFVAVGGGFDSDVRSHRVGKTAADSSSEEAASELDVDRLSSAMHGAIVALLGECDESDGGAESASAGRPSRSLLRALLGQPPEEEAEEERRERNDAKENPDGADGGSGDDDDGNGASRPQPLLLLSGLPRRPYHRELARRLLLIRSRLSSCGDAPTLDGRWLIPASELGMAESSPLPSIPPLLPIPSADVAADSIHTSSSCLTWLRSASDPSILRLLGLRRTVGTVIGFLPPDPSSLLRAANKPLRPDAKPPRLTVAARARAKHAHRGSEGFFGEAKGGAEAQSAEAERILRRLLREAAWINIHVFGGTEDVPILEVRVAEGYGARWAIPRDGGDVAFRGFLEPQMEDGHERRWRH